jgi:hypothetical protein
MLTLQRNGHLVPLLLVNNNFIVSDNSGLRLGMGIRQTMRENPPKDRPSAMQ